jgi:phospholipid N-methyltransferase
VVKKILSKYIDLVQEGGIISYFEYILIGRFTRVFSFGISRSRYNEIYNITKEFLKKYEIKKGKIFRNIPPAWVHHAKIQEK